jgi:hypothetical protein
LLAKVKRLNHNFMHKARPVRAWCAVNRTK